MKTTKEVNDLLTELAKDESNVGLAKAIALMEYNREAYEIQKDEEGDFQVFRIEDGEKTDLVEPIEENEERANHIVLTDEEADEKAKEYILDSVWAFNPSFLAGETDIDREVFEAIQANNRCESNNEAILRLIEDEDSFVESAIRADGRGHFITSYDGEEHEQKVGNITFFIYRMN